MKEEIKKILKEAGASAVGFAPAGETDSGEQQFFGEWLDKEYHGEMIYLRRHQPLRENTDSVLQNSKTVISVAFSYAPKEWRDGGLPVISSYAYGEDYHNVIRKLLEPAIKSLKEKYGGKWRICIDSAPVSERYWALKSGLGIKGKNGFVIVEETGSFCFLIEIVTTLEIEPDEESKGNCLGCEACIKACPAGAIKSDGNFEARKCINYLTIEKKGEFTAEEKELLKSGTGFLFGCDICQKVCPHNKGIKESEITQFGMKPAIRTLNVDEILRLNESEFNTLFSDSPLHYAGFSRLQRNAEALRPEGEHG